MSAAAKRGRLSSAHSRRSWRCSERADRASERGPIRATADRVPSGIGGAVSGSVPMEQQIRANLAKLDALAVRGDERLWLIFYLWGQPESLRCVAEALEATGW